MIFMKILLDPGHGPKENRGSIIGHEGDNMYYFGQIFKKALEKFGFQVGLTRNELRENPNLERRGNLAKGYDLFISLHTNAGPYSARGCEIFGDLNANDPALMKKMCETISTVLQTKNRGVKWRRRQDGKIFTQEKSPGGSNWYGVLYHNKAPVGMLVEFCFHTNLTDLRAFLNLQEVLAEKLAHLLASHYKKDMISSTSQTLSKTRWNGIISLYSRDFFEKASKISRERNYLILPHDYYTGTGRSWKEWRDAGKRIIALGGVKSNHTAYQDEFLKE